MKYPSTQHMLDAIMNDDNIADEIWNEYKNISADSIIDHVLELEPKGK